MACRSHCFCLCSFSPCLPSFEIVKVDQHKELVYVDFLVRTDGQDLDWSLNSWLAQSQLLVNLTKWSTNNNTLTSSYSIVDPGNNAQDMQIKFILRLGQLQLTAFVDGTGQSLLKDFLFVGPCEAIKGVCWL